MAKKDKKMLSLQKLASVPPVLPVISDHPLEKETAGQDKFDLCYRLGPPRPNRQTSENLLERIKTEKVKLLDKQMKNEAF
jgi:hypothetical protein